MLVPLEHAQFLQSVEPVWYVELLPSVLLACRAPPVAQAKGTQPAGARRALRLVCFFTACS